MSRRRKEGRWGEERSTTTRRMGERGEGRGGRRGTAEGDSEGKNAGEGQ